MSNWSNLRAEPLLRGVLLVYVVFVASPMRYWMLSSDKIDETWLFALNYGAAHGLAFGRDLVWTNGPLGFLTFPQNIGHNLAYGFLFQICTWVLLGAIFTDLFFRAAIPLRNLCLFSLAVGLASPLFWYNYNNDYLFSAGALTLLVLVRFDGGMARYVTALVIIGIVPLIRLNGGIDGALALCGFLVDRVILLRWKAWREVALAAVVPIASAAVGLWLTVPSLTALRRYVRGSLEIMSGYSVAASKAGPALELVAALATLAAIVFLVQIPAKPGFARFFVLLLGLPLLFGMKHAFVRQDNHIVNFFCLAALAIGLIALYAEFPSWRKYAALAAWRKYAALAVMVPLPIIILPRLASHPIVLGQASGVSAIRAVWLAWRSATAGRTPAQEKGLMGSKAPGPSVEPEIRAILRDSTVAFIPWSYSSAYFDNLNLQIYPVVTQFAAYTRYLDDLNAEWVRTKAPRFLIFSVDGFERRHPWAQSPAMWAEVYRNYETRLLTTRNLLLERRREPRFARFETVKSAQIPMPGELALPPAEVASFWSLTCRMTVAGSLQKLLWRVPEMTMAVDTDDGNKKEYRSITAVLTAPVMGAWLPGTLPGFAAVLQHDPAPGSRVKKLIFGGPGASLYQSSCEVRWFRPVR